MIQRLIDRWGRRRVLAEARRIYGFDLSDKERAARFRCRSGRHVSCAHCNKPKGITP